MNNIAVLALCIASMFVGYWAGYFQGAFDFHKIIDAHKETIATYKKILGIE